MSDSEAPTVTSAFDSGNIEVVKQQHANFDLKIRQDPFTHGTDKKAHFQWFHFRASNVMGHPCVFNLTNAGEASYAKAWVGYRAACSYDRKTWFRVPTTYKTAAGQGGTLTIKLTPMKSTVYVAYFAPYSYERHMDLVYRCDASDVTKVSSLGLTLDGRDIDLIEVGAGKLHVWVTARQHPGESMAEWFADGLLERLLDQNDALAGKLRHACTFHIVPNMNPDGSVRGYLRTNACGANLNREWTSTGEYKAPTLERSPEVFHTLKAMDKTGVDLFFDIHGDEVLPHSFFAGGHGTTVWTPRHSRLLQIMAEGYQRANPDFGSLLFGYGTKTKGTANMAVATAQIVQRFECLGATIEQPFKDCFDNQDPVSGYSGPRAQKLGASLLDAIAGVVPFLKSDAFEFDESKLPEWVLPGYKCPPHEECTWKWDYTGHVPKR